MKCEFFEYSSVKSDIVMPDPFQPVGQKTTNYTLKNGR